MFGRAANIVGRGDERLEHQLTVAPRATAEVRLTLQPPKEAGEYLITADVESDGLAFRRWAEALVIVE